MIDALRHLYHAFIEMGDSEWAVWILALDSFIESIFWPIPPDPFLIGMALQDPAAGLWLAALTTAMSVAGAVIGHWLGRRFGRPFLLRFVKPDKVDRAEQLFQRYGPWAVLVAAFTPIPYKVFTITAGVLAMELRPFIIASAIGRGARFFLLGGLISAFGEPINGFIETQFETLTIMTTAALVLAAAAYLVLRRYQSRRASRRLEEQV